ncbi:MAG TPA: DUF3105 domain-containing protein [Actinomycetota bacterium]|nr:DUF3105 domain-containing protein [Actinomycetota bacterium]
MAKKKRKRPRTRPPSAPSAPSAPARGGANLERRDRKEEARRLREAERRRVRRSSAFRRTFVSIGIAAAAVAAISLFRAFGGPNDIPEEAVRAAEAAGCTAVDQPAASAPSGQHLQPGQQHTYPDTPAASGFHDPSPLPDDPKVYDQQPPETRAVHSLEHGAVFVYYLPEANGGLAQDVVDRLADVAEGSDATYLSPYPTLTADRALTLAAWNRRQSCPAGQDLTPDAATTIASGFVTAFGCTGNAPENGASPC